MTYWNRQGQPINHTEWCQLHRDISYRILADDETNSGKRITTIWQGAFLDKLFATYLVPIEYIGTEIGRNYRHCLRNAYLSEIEALEGHEQQILIYGGRLGKSIIGSSIDRFTQIILDN